MLNYIWAGFFFIAFVVAVAKLLIGGDTGVFTSMLNATFDNAKTGFEIALYLTGVMTLWLGLMRIGEKAGVINLFSRAIYPFFKRLFPGIPRDHPATGSIIMNFSANLLGLDNAALPLGIKAMQELQDVNTDKEVASNAQIMFLVLNTSGLTIIPLSIILDRSVLHAGNPTDIFIPTLIATYCSSLTGMILVSIRQRINLFDRVVLGYLITFTAIIAFAIYYFGSLTQAELETQSNFISAAIILSVIVFFITFGFIRKVPMFETFIDGAREGFQTTIKIIPYLVGILVAIGVFRASGTLDYFLDGFRWVVQSLGLNADFVDAMPVAFLKPLSGGAARSMMIDTINHYGPDSFAGRLASVMRGCTETTFYILAVYFGAVNIKRTRYALTYGLITDLVGIIAAIFIAYIFFH